MGRTMTASKAHPKGTKIKPAADGRKADRQQPEGALDDSELQGVSGGAATTSSTTTTTTNTNRFDPYKNFRF